MEDFDILMELADRPIAYHRAFVRVGVGITGALMLGQALYWSRRTDDAQGWFYKTQVEWEEETGMTRREQEGARARLRELGLMEEAKRGVPCKTYYRVLVDPLFTLLREAAQKRQSSLHKTAKLDCTKPPSSAAQNSQSITETTQRLQQKEKVEARVTRKALPDDFAPTEQHRTMAQQHGLNLEQEFEQFKDHHAAAGSRFLDWHAALRTWLRNAAKWQARGGQAKPAKNAPAARQGAANGKLLDGNGKPKSYTEGVDDDGFAKL